MPVRSSSRRLGGSLYRWIVLRLLRRRLHPETRAHIKTKHAHCSHKSIRLRGPGFTHGTGSPQHKENGKSSITSEGENENNNREKENEDPAGGITTENTKVTQGNREMFTIDNTLCETNPLSEVQTIYGALSSRKCSLLHEGNVCITRSRIQLVREAPEGCRYSSHINTSQQEVGVSGDGNCSTIEVRHHREQHSPTHDASGGRTFTQAGPSAKSLSVVATPTRICKSNPRRTKKGPFPLLNVQGLDQGSVQSLTIPQVCKHISAVRQWDSISVLYGIEYLTVRKKVHERLLCILRERRERRLRKEARESILGGGRPKKHPHRRKGRKRKAKIKHDSKKDGKANKIQDEVENQHVTLATPKELVGSDKVRASESNSKDSKAVGELVRCGTVDTKDEDEEESPQQQWMDEEQDKEKEILRENSEPCEGSPSVGSGDSRPSRSPSYHQVTSSEKSSSVTSYLRSGDTLTRDISPGETPRSSANTIPSATSSSASSSSNITSSPGSSPSAKSTGGPSTSDRTSPTVAYISDDESASERRRSTLYCCPCFVTFKNKTKKTRKR